MLSSSFQVHNDAHYSSEPVCNVDNNDLGKCGGSVAVSNYSDYEINEFLQPQPVTTTSMTMNYFNSLPSNQPLNNLHNSLILLDDVAKLPDERSAEKNDISEPHYIPSTFPYQPSGNLLEPNDFIIVSSEEIINNCEDILDLTTDEVEQIFDDDNLMNNNLFNNSMSHILPTITIEEHKPQYHQDEFQQCLNKFSQQETFEKCEEGVTKSVLESDDTDAIEHIEAPNEGCVKRKGGRPKGARKSCKYNTTNY